MQCLNKEQGIQWIKLERLPAFLESDCYTEYRLAKLVGQAQVAGSKPEDYVLTKLIAKHQTRKHHKHLDDDDSSGEDSDEGSAEVRKEG